MSLVTVDQLRAALSLQGRAVPDARLEPVCAAANAKMLGDGTRAGWLKAGIDHSGHADCCMAALAVAVQLWMAQSNPGGQVTGDVLNPSITPHLLGAGLKLRVRGLANECFSKAGLT